MDVILIRDGQVTNVIAAQSAAAAGQFYPGHTCIERTPALAHVGPGYAWDGSNLSAPSLPPTAPRTLDKADFIARFTPAEYAAVKALRATDANVDWLMAILDAAKSEINLDSPRLLYGLSYIEGLPGSPLAAGRAAQIAGE